MSQNNSIPGKISSMILVEFATLKIVNGICQIKTGRTCRVFEYTCVDERNSSVFHSSIFFEAWQRKIYDFFSSKKKIKITMLLGKIK